MVEITCQETNKIHTVIIHKWSRFNDGKRWDNELVKFESFVDYKTHNVSYIVDYDGLLALLPCEQKLVHIELVKNLSDFDAVKTAFSRIHNSEPVDKVVALSEFNLLTAALLRAEFNILGSRPEEVKRYRDKVLMKEYIQRAGIRTPYFASLNQWEECKSLISGYGFPLVLKPKDGAASQGVQIVQSREDIKTYTANIDTNNYELEEFIDYDLYHIDGYYAAEEEHCLCLPFSYIGRPLDFNHGKPIGTVLQTDPVFIEKCQIFAQACCQALGLTDTPFHIEAFYNPQENEFIFLEMGARIGGADIPIVINDLLHINLYEIWIKRLLGKKQPLPSQPNINSSTGFVLFPRPSEETIRVLQVSSFINHISTVYRELIPETGSILSGTQTYNSLLPGRFLLKGASADTIFNHLNQIINHFQFDWELLAQNKE